MGKREKINKLKLIHNLLYLFAGITLGFNGFQWSDLILFILIMSIDFISAFKEFKESKWIKNTYK